MVVGNVGSSKIRFHGVTSVKKYLILGLVILNNMFNQAMPTMALSVLLKEISIDLGMNIVQAGYLWGAPQILAIFSGFFGGAIADRFGERKILIYASYGLALLAAARVFAASYAHLFIIVTLFGIFTPLTMLANFKLFENLFDENELSFANGLMSAGMALGFLVGAGISATWVAPVLGGWRQVFLAYGLISLIFPTIFIFVLDAAPIVTEHSGALREVITSLKNAIKKYKIWLLGLGLFGINSAVQAYLGYLPTYLQDIGWTITDASAVLMGFQTASLIIAVLVAIYSRRLSSSRRLTIITSIVVTTGILLTGSVTGPWIAVAVIIAGIFRDAFMAMFFTYVAEVSRKIGVASGAALGFAMMMNGIGNVIAPPLGNSFEVVSKTTPFMIWAGMGVIGVTALIIIQQRKGSR